MFLVIKKCGPKQHLTNEAEQELRNWILEGQMIGDPKTRENIKQAAWILSEKEENCKKFGENRPSNGFIDKFLKRNPDLRSRKPEILSSAAANITKNNIVSWFEQIEQYFSANNIMDILSDATRVINCDETGFRLNPVGSVVIARKNSSVNQVVKNEKEQITVLYGFSADGFAFDPFITYPGVRLNNDVKSQIPKGINYVMTPTGWMTTQAFCHFLKTMAAQARNRNVQFPIALFLDGHKSHEGIEVARVAREEQIVLVRLYPNATSYYQPADKGIFRPLKALYEKFVSYNRTFENIVPCKKNFAYILSRIHIEIDPNWIRRSFEVCGLFPFNKDAFNYSSLKTNNSLQTNSEPESFSVVSSLIDPVVASTDESLIESSKFEESPVSITISSHENNEVIQSISNEENDESCIEINNASEQTKTTSALKRKREFYSLDSPFHTFCSTVGREKIQKFDDPNFLTEMENEKLLYETYQNLKEHEKKRTSPLTLPQHKKPARKGRINNNNKLHFVSTSEEYVTKIEEKHDLKAKLEFEKAERKLLRESNKKKREEKNNLKKTIKGKENIP